MRSGQKPFKIMGNLLGTNRSSKDHCASRKKKENVINPLGDCCFDKHFSFLLDEYQRSRQRLSFGNCCSVVSFALCVANIFHIHISYTTNEGCIIPKNTATLIIDRLIMSVGLLPVRDPSQSGICSSQPK